LDEIVVYVKPGSVVSDDWKTQEFENKLLSGKNFSKC
jgi:hypothetical protein